MRSAFYFCLSLLLSIQLFSQDETKTPKTWEFGIQPSFLVHQLFNSSSDASNHTYLENRSVGYQMGILSRYRISEKWLLELYTGIHWLEHEIIEPERVLVKKFNQLYYFASPNLQYFLNTSSHNRWYILSGTHVGFTLPNTTVLRPAQLGNMVNIYFGGGYDWKWNKFKMAPQINIHYSPVGMQTNLSYIHPFRLHMISFGLKIYG